jgi:transposase InsO family protein
VFRRGDELVSRFQFVADHRHTFEVKRLCELVQVRRSSFYAWLAGAPARAARAEDDRRLAERIKVIHDGDNTVGAPRVTPELNEVAGQLDEHGVPRERVNHKRVARAMREHGIRGYTKRRRGRTTIPEQSDAKLADLLKRDFTAPAPNRRYVGDITFLPIADGTNLYLATVIGCFSRRLVRWSIADHMRTELVEDAPPGREGDPREPGRGHLPQRSRVGLHIQGLRQAVPGVRRDPVHGSRRDEHRQRPRGGGTR